MKTVTTQAELDGKVRGKVMIELGAIILVVVIMLVGLGDVMPDG